MRKSCYQGVKSKDESFPYFYAGFLTDFTMLLSGWAEGNFRWGLLCNKKNDFLSMENF